jgi:hypothetical protein
MKRRYLFWILTTEWVLGFGWYKSAENRRESEVQSAWRDWIDFLTAVSSAMTGSSTS